MRARCSWQYIGTDIIMATAHAFTEFLAGVPSLADVERFNLGSKWAIPAQVSAASLQHVHMRMCASSMPHAIRPCTCPVPSRTLYMY